MAPAYSSSSGSPAGIITSFGDLIGILRAAGIPLHHALYDDQGPEWAAATLRPDLFLHEEWAIAAAGDPVATAVQRSPFQHGPRYYLVQTIQVKGAPVIQIYKRD
jgi:hypothetical protein